MTHDPRNPETPDPRGRRPGTPDDREPRPQPGPHGADPYAPGPGDPQYAGGPAGAPPQPPPNPGYPPPNAGRYGAPPAPGRPAPPGATYQPGTAPPPGSTAPPAGPPGAPRDPYGRGGGPGSSPPPGMSPPWDPYGPYGPPPGPRPPEAPPNPPHPQGPHGPSYPQGPPGAQPPRGTQAPRSVPNPYGRQAARADAPPPGAYGPPRPHPGPPQSARPPIGQPPPAQQDGRAGQGPPLYRPEQGWGAAGFALPDEYRRQDAEEGAEAEPPRRTFLSRLSKPVRVTALAVTLVVAVGVAVGMPFRENWSDYQKRKQVAQAYTDVPKNKAAAIAGTRFVLGSIGPADSYLTSGAPAGTAGVKAVVYFKSPTKQTIRRLSYLEYVFRDADGNVYAPTSMLGGGGLAKPGKISKVTFQAVVPKAAASRVRPVVRPKHALDYQAQNPTKAVTDPALVFQR